MKKNLNIFDIDYSKDIDAKNITTMKVSARLKGVFYPKNQSELIFLYNYLKINKIPFKILGNGSNVIFSKKAENLTILSTKKIKPKIYKRENFLYANSSASLSQIYRFCLQNNLSGFESLAGIPATLGGALYMNASAFGHQIFDNLVSVKVLKNGRVVSIKKDKINFTYRNGGLSDCLILSAKFLLKPQDKCQIQNDFVKYMLLRGEKQPKGNCAGSIFKNPAYVSAGYLIDQCGLKGFEMNGAKFSNLHANFIINNGEASFADIQYLINLAYTKVYKKFKIKLEKEVELI